MEILIVGVVIVALMAYASTKIKNSAAQAFEREEIEAEDYTITKPEGFINPINNESAFAFEAYTKDLGKDAAKNFKQAWAILRIISNSDFQAVCKNAKNSSGAITSKRFVEEAPDGQKIFLLESEKIEKDVKICCLWKIVESRARKKVYEFQVSVLEDYREDFAAKAGEMIESFVVK